MCGIGAIFARNRMDNIGKIALEMAEIQHHRGPDNKDVHVTSDKRVALSHARLSIIDLSTAGNQPLCNEDGTIWLVCNGEIYNHREIRGYLLKRGHEFRSASDSEIILHLYEEKGTELQTFLNGMFAFVLYDSNKDIMFCARDRIGEKPLVYAQTPNGLAIASEIPAVKLMHDVDLRVDPTALGLYLLRNLRHIPDPWTFYRGIRRLPPGHAMVIRNGEVERVWKYWKPSFAIANYNIEDVRSVFDASVASRSVADVEVGALLSGGVDSSGIVQAMISQGNEGIRTYAMGLDKDDEELERARKMAKLLGTRHKEYYFDPVRQHELFERLLQIHGEPIMLLPLMHTYELCEHIRADGLRVVINGNGADELFYGYNGHNKLAFVSSLIKYMPSLVSPILKRIGSSCPVGSKIREFLLVAGSVNGRRKQSLYQDEAQQLWTQLFLNSDLQSLIKDTVAEWLGTWFESEAPSSYIDEANIIGLMHENTHSVTIPGDLAAMAASVEARAPFLNHEMVEMAWGISYKEKIKSYRDKSKNKWILKQALEGRVPSELLYAAKRGFGYNISEENVLRGPWKQRVDLAFKEMTDLGGILNLDSILRIKKEFDDRGQVPAMLIAKLYAVLKTVS